MPADWSIPELPSCEQKQVAICEHGTLNAYIQNFPCWSSISPCRTDGRTTYSALERLQQCSPPCSSPQFPSPSLEHDSLWDNPHSGESICTIHTGGVLLIVALLKVARSVQCVIPPIKLCGYPWPELRRFPVPILGMLCGGTISAIVVATNYVLKELE